MLFKRLSLYFCVLILGIGLGYSWRIYHNSIQPINRLPIASVYYADIAYDATNILTHKIARKYLTGGTRHE